MSEWFGEQRKCKRNIHSLTQQAGRTQHDVGKHLLENQSRSSPKMVLDQIYDKQTSSLSQKTPCASCKSVSISGRKRHSHSLPRPFKGGNCHRSAFDWTEMRRMASQARIFQPHAGRCNGLAIFEIEEVMIFPSCLPGKSLSFSSVLIPCINTGVDRKGKNLHNSKANFTGLPRKLQSTLRAVLVLFRV